MGRYTVRRLLVALPTVLAVAFAVSVLVVPAHPCDALTASFPDAICLWGDTMSPRELQLHESRERVRGAFEWVGSALRGDLGTSLHSGEAVRGSIARRSLVSMQLAFMAITFAVLMAVPLGVLAAVRRGGWPDRLTRLAALAGRSVPEFLLGALAVFALSYGIGWWPDLDYPPPWENATASLLAFLFPALIVGWRIGAIGTRMTRSAVLDVLRQDHVRTARAKGLSEHAVLTRHTLRNALPGVLKIMGTQLTAVLSGLVVIEIVFGIPGLGTLGFDALQLQDYPVVQGVVFVTALCVIGTNLVVDVARAAMDPRIRYQ